MKYLPTFQDCLHTHYDTMKMSGYVLKSKNKEWWWHDDTYRYRVEEDSDGGTMHLKVRIMDGTMEAQIDGLPSLKRE
jgi:hypothetical protein